MAKQQGLSSRIDAKQFFEASVSALRAESEPIGRNRSRAIVQRSATDESQKKRAVADAARALTALWKMQTSIRSI